MIEEGTIREHIYKGWAVGFRADGAGRRDRGTPPGRERRTTGHRGGSEARRDTDIGTTCSSTPVRALAVPVFGV